MSNLGERLSSNLERSSLTDHRDVIRRLLQYVDGELVSTHPAGQPCQVCQLFADARHLLEIASV